jgi:putative tryptophan/tyrosine transport system substrate-binding protein
VVPAINGASAGGAGALNVLASPMLFLNRHIIIDRAAELRLPPIYQWPVPIGSLRVYGSSSSMIRARLLIAQVSCGWSRIALK